MAVVCPSLKMMIRHCVFEGALFFPAATPYWGHESHDPTGLGILVGFLQKLVKCPPHVSLLPKSLQGTNGNGDVDDLKC